MYEDWEFERWETPVSNERLLSMVSLIDDSEILTIVIDGLPNKRIRFVFTDYPAYRNIQELYRTELWNKLYRKNLGITLIIPKSEWIESFRQSKELLDVYHPNAVHYMICTDDGCVEVLSNEPPEITEIGIDSEEGADYESPDI
ncbi:MAG: hypothetical protein H0V88_01470 [Pyrinomonadaceae bacterium]|nr:hypothetical protein [Pyrinomonadaceae bacterium]